MNRQDFRKLSKEGQLITIQQANHLMKEAGVKMLRKAVNDYSAVVALELHDELNFGHKRTAKFLAKVAEQFENIQDGRLTIENIKATLHEEVGILIK
jgi:lysozyme family protein